MMMPLIFAGLGACAAVTAGLVWRSGWWQSLLDRVMPSRRPDDCATGSCTPDTVWVGVDREPGFAKFTIESDSGVTVTLSGPDTDPEAWFRIVWQLPTIMHQATVKRGQS